MNPSYVALIPFLVLAACSDAAGGNEFDTPTAPQAAGTPADPAGTGSPPPAGSNDFGNVLDGGSGGPGSQPANCAEATEFIYVIDRDNRLFKFDPTVPSPSAFSLIGPMGCQVGKGPNSMSVGRDGFAYVLYGSYDLFNTFSCMGVHKVDITTAACAGATPFQCKSAGFNKFGMGFATDTAGGSTDALYLSNSESPALGRADLGTGVVQPLGSLPGAAEFTGNSMGELWGFFPDQTPPAVLQIDKASGTILTTLSLASLPPAPTYGSYAYAFATWGGAFYIFYYVEDRDPSTNVWKLEANGTLTQYIANVGSVIVGAGVSTCAPVEPPK